MTDKESCERKLQANKEQTNKELQQEIDKKIKEKATGSSHLIVDTNIGMMRCLDCQERHPIPRAKIRTAIRIMEGFKKAHNDMGCSEESYLRKKFLAEIEVFDEKTGRWIK